MVLEDSNKIDIIGKSKDGKVFLAMTDAGITTDPQERLKKFFDKLKSYMGYVLSDDFKKEYPGIKCNDIQIKVICKNKPTDEMKAVTGLTHHNNRSCLIPVEFEVFK